MVRQALGRVEEDVEGASEEDTETEVVRQEAVVVHLVAAAPAGAEGEDLVVLEGRAVRAVGLETVEGWVGVMAVVATAVVMEEAMAEEEMEEGGTEEVETVVEWVVVMAVAG